MDKAGEFRWQTSSVSDVAELSDARYVRLIGGLGITEAGSRSVKRSRHDLQRRSAPRMSERTETVVGCPKCGTNRFEPIQITDRGDMHLKCVECGTPVIAKDMWTDAPDRNGNVYLPGCCKGIPDARRSDKKNAS